MPKPKVLYAALIGRIVEHHRTGRGIHQEAIAQALGISQSAYSRLDKGQSAMSVTQLHIVATQLGTSPAARFTANGGLRGWLQAKLKRLDL